MAMSVIVVMIAPILYQLHFINAISHVLVIHHNSVEVLGVLMSFEQIVNKLNHQQFRQQHPVLHLL